MPTTTTATQAHESDRTTMSDTPVPSRTGIPTPPSEAMRLESGTVIQDGIVYMPLARYAKEVGTSMARHLAQRRGESVYQVASYSIPFIPKEVLWHLLDSQDCEHDVLAWTEPVYTWSFDTLEKVQSVAGRLMKASNELVAGTTRALKTKSEKYSRVVASMMAPLEISHIREEDRVTISFAYVLADEAGELHPPKTADRREMAIDPEDTIILRQKILDDLRTMAAADFPLSPNFFRQLGMHDRAEELERPPSRPPSRPAAADTTVEQETHGEIDEILDERSTTGRARRWFLVRWAGYDAAWEEWRIHGEPGTPLETWEPEAHVRRSDAFKAWNATRAAQNPKKRRRPRS